MGIYMKKKLLCLSAILAMTSTTMVSFANEVTNYISEDNKNEIVQPRAQYAVVNASNVNIRYNAGTSYKVAAKLRYYSETSKILYVYLEVLIKKAAKCF